MAEAVLERVVPARFPMVGSLRRATNEFLLDGYTPKFRETLLLVVSELCTNAIEALGDPDSQFTLRLHDYDNRVQIEVEDAGPGFGSALHRPGAGASEQRGRGLQVVRALVDEFGVERTHGQTRVFCVIYRA